MWNEYIPNVDRNISREMNTDAIQCMSVAPLLWYSMIVMKAYVDCGMHLIFHGIVAYSVGIMDGILSDHGQTPQFLEIVNEHLMDTEEL